MRCTLVRCTPMRHTHEVHAHEAHAYEVHAHKIHAHEIHTHEIHDIVLSLSFPMSRRRVTILKLTGQVSLIYTLYTTCNQTYTVTTWHFHLLPTILRPCIALANYSFAFPLFSSSLALSFNTLRRILPAALLGISSTNRTPPLNFL
jgi:hypothetical protein